MPTETTNPPETETVPGTDSQSKPENKWTLMFYIAGDASLSASMISQLKELTDAGYQENTTVLAYFDPNCNGRNARIFEVNHFRKKRGFEAKNHPTKKLKFKATNIGDGKDPYVRNIAEDCHIQGLQQMPAAVTLRYFLEYSRTYYPAENYMLFLMGHGVIVGNDSFLPDSDDGSAITLKDLGKILTRFKEKLVKGQEFHLVGFHSCSMNSIEVACELQGSARFMLGTQGSAFPGSWPYRQLLKKIFCAIERYKDKQFEPEQYPNPLVQEILTGLQDLSFYNSEDFWHAGFSADISMCSLDKNKLNQLLEPLNALTAALKDGLKNDAMKGILLAHWESQSYWGEKYADLYDLCDRLESYCKEQDAIRDACRKVKIQLEPYKRKSKDDVAPCFDRLIAFSDYYGPSYQFSHGLSIYFPWSAPTEKVMINYANYAFTTGSNAESWNSFLTDYFTLTKRPVLTKGRPEKVVPKHITPLHPPNRANWWDGVSDETLLTAGLPPFSKPTATLGDPNKPTATLAEGDPNKPTATLAEGDPNKPTATLAEGDPNKPTATLAEGDPNKPTATLAEGDPNKPTATLAEGDPNKPTATLAEGDPNKPTATLAEGDPNKPTATLAEGDPNKPTATLAEGDPNKPTATLAEGDPNKPTATLAEGDPNKPTATLAEGDPNKPTATLAEGDPNKPTATLAEGDPNKPTATLAEGDPNKPTAALGDPNKPTATMGLFGLTFIKNFSAPEDIFITSRPHRLKSRADTTSGRPD